MSYIEMDTERCKGCLLCAHFCPKNLIEASPNFNRKGYAFAQIPPEKMKECIGCAACALTCPDMVIKVYRTVKEKTEKGNTQIKKDKA